MEPNKKRLNDDTVDALLGAFVVHLEDFVAQGRRQQVMIQASEKVGSLVTFGSADFGLQSEIWPLADYVFNSTDFYKRAYIDIGHGYATVVMYDSPADRILRDGFPRH